MLAKVREDAGFLDLLFEALERALKVFFVVNNDFGQTRFPRDAKIGLLNEPKV